MVSVQHLSQVLSQLQVTGESASETNQGKFCAAAESHRDCGMWLLTWRRVATRLGLAIGLDP